MPATDIQFENLGSLITYKTAAGDDQCLGDLFYSPERGVFDPTLGKVEIDPQYVEPHNRALSQALIEGLDQNCQVGQGHFAYLTKAADGKPQVTTWHGDLISADVTVRGAVITFRRRGKTYRGREQRDGNYFNYKRVS